jgi:hypothetical protein
MAIASDPSPDAGHSDNVPSVKIGVVIYQLSKDGQFLTAKWYHTDVGSNLVGSGKAARISGDNFEGEFDISYSNADGTPAGQFRLRILKQKDVYSLSWSDGDVKHFDGIGIETAHGLVAGWNHTAQSA